MRTQTTDTLSFFPHPTFCFSVRISKSISNGQPPLITHPVGAWRTHSGCEWVPTKNFLRFQIPDINPPVLTCCSTRIQDVTKMGRNRVIVWLGTNFNLVKVSD